MISACKLILSWLKLVKIPLFDPGILRWLRMQLARFKNMLVMMKPRI